MVGVQTKGRGKSFEKKICVLSCQSPSHVNSGHSVATDSKIDVEDNFERMFRVNSQGM